MYKTIRHGENSLQYTILPQNDDFRNNALDPEQQALQHSRRGNSATRTGNGSKRKNKSSLLGYIGLFFVCSVVTGAILVPLLVTTDLMPSPATWFIKAQKAREFRNQVNLKYIIDNNNNLNNNVNNNKKSTSDSDIIANLSNADQKNYDKISSSSLSGISSLNYITSTATAATINNSKLISSTQSASYEINLNENEKSLIKIETIKFPSTQHPPGFIISTSIPTTAASTASEAIKIEIKPTIQLTVPPTPELTKVTTTSPPTTLLQSTTAASSSAIKNDNIIIITPTSINLLPHNPSKPKILYQEITSRQNSTLNNQTNDYVAKIHLSPSETNKNSESKNWIKSHWPFVDPSTYFQWAGYDSEDSVLLPAILCAALIVILLLLTLCILARNRKLFVNSIWIRKRSRDPFGRGVANDLQGADDNTTLLVNENASEEE